MMGLVPLENETFFSSELGSRTTPFSAGVVGVEYIQNLTMFQIVIHVWNDFVIDDVCMHILKHSLIHKDLTKK